jgi:uncharacterized 2Fe-2S/4Fe-4S cluster protein (DUF4445 family)
MDDSITISVQNGALCETTQGSNILSALAAAGISVSAPCGRQGICGKCKVKLIRGIVRIAGNQVNEGEFFSACKGIAFSDIGIFLPDELSEMQIPPSVNIRKVNHAGVALDIGTTTIQAELVDLENGESLETISVINKQRQYGADVLTRIYAAQNGQLRGLFEIINHQTEEILRQYISKWNLAAIEKCAVSGNTTMLHLFCNVDPCSMGKAPFTPAFLEEKYFDGPELSLSAKKITLLPGISAFIGADIASGLAFLDILNHGEDALFIDIGTNGETALWKADKKQLLCCSTAAGPCFEGSVISCGMGAFPGAINRITFNTKELGANYFNFWPLSYATLGNIPARGICGAGLIDAIAVIKQSGAMDETGALQNKYRQSGFPIAPGIAVTQKDIRQFQMAKSAIRSGIDLICKKAELSNNAVSVYIAGAFGFFLNLKNAVSVGLFPDHFINGKISVCGGTSLFGAIKCLLDPEFLPRCHEVISHSETINLASDTAFSTAFEENMYF